jgi:hypothetical protein
MPRKQQKNMNGGGFFDFLGFKTAQDISPDERAKHLKELEAKSSKEQKITKLENPAVATAATADEVPADADKKDEVRPATGGRRQRRKTRKSSS